MFEVALKSKTFPDPPPSLMSRPPNATASMILVPFVNKNRQKNQRVT